MSEFIILFKGSFADWNKKSPDETQKIMEKYHAFVSKLKSEGRMRGGSALKGGGFEISPTPMGPSVDGPFSESREALTGYMIFEAENFETAVEIAKSCPALTHGESLLVHQLSDN